jgi:trehalose synthase
MLPNVYTPVKKLEAYRKYLTAKQFEEIKTLADKLKGLKVNMVNATPRGGGVAEILKSLIPLMKGVGLKANWYTIPGREDFFKITKAMHNALQGRAYEFPFSHRKRYLRHMEKSASQMRDMEADIWVIHDPQPAGVIQFLPHFHPSVCQLHIDLTSPNQEVWDFVTGYLEMYDKVVVSSKEFVRQEIKTEAIVFPPAIDPLTPKNQALDLESSRAIVKSFGINPEKPLITQVSRFDPWKDPLGVVKAYFLAKKEIPDLQLAMLGLFLAHDDPEAMRVYRKVKKETKKDPDVFLFADPNILGGLKVDTFVNAMQIASDVILQKSFKEGFGLTLTEAMWKGKPVIGGKAAGIRTQIKNGENGFIAGSARETAERIIEILKNKDLAEKMGRQAHLSVKKNFLLPRLLRDYLKLFVRLVSSKQKKSNGDAEIMNILNSY